MGRRKKVTLLPSLNRIIDCFPDYVTDVENHICKLIKVTNGEFSFDYTEPLELCVRDLITQYGRYSEVGEELELDHDHVFQEITDRVDYELYASCYEAGVVLGEGEDHSETKAEIVDLMFSTYVEFFVYLTRSTVFWDNINFNNCASVVIHDCDDFSAIEFNTVN